jgi:hypothetical protein
MILAQFTFLPPFNTPKIVLPVWLFRIQNRDEERQHPPVTRIRAVFNGIPVLGARQFLEIVLDVFVLPACQSTTARAEVVDFSPAFFRPPGWRRSDGVVEFVCRSVQQLPHDPVVFETPRFLKQTGTVHPLEVFQQLSSLCLIPGNFRNYFPDLDLTWNLTTLLPLVPRHGRRRPLHSHTVLRN